MSKFDFPMFLKNGFLYNSGYFVLNFRLIYSSVSEKLCCDWIDFSLAIPQNTENYLVTLVK